MQFPISLPLQCTVSQILPLICELISYVTTNDLERYCHSKAAVEVIAQAIVVISFLGNIWNIFSR